MTLQSRSNNSNVPFILAGDSYESGNETILQDAGRAVPLLFGTVMARIAGTLKWVPLVSLVLTTGASVARGIYTGPEITAAALVAGDVVDSPILVGGACVVDEDQVVMDAGTLAITDVIEAATIQARTVSDDLRSVGIFLNDTVAVSEFENA